jgi:hypothetical protein
MSTIYRAVCTHCHHAPEMSDGGLVAYATFDGRSDGSILPGGYLAFRRDDGEIVPLPHPLEDATLRENGGSWGSASRSGRLLCVTYKVCTACGTLHKEMRVHWNVHAGCIGALLAAAATVLVCTQLLSLPFLCALKWVFIMPFAFLGIGSLLCRLRWRSVNASMRLARCSACGGSRFCTVDQATRRAMMCPNCKTRSMVYSMAGRS